MTIFFFGLITLLVLLPIVEVLAERHDLRRYPSAGCLISVNEKRLHVVQQGTTHSDAAPIVVLEAGLAATSLSWVFTPPLLAVFAHVVSYDRAGLGRSSGSKRLPSLQDLLSDLHALIQTLPNARPLILVGHSFGGLLIQSYANRHPDRIAGLVLVDPVSLLTYAKPDPHHRKRLKLAERLSRRGAWLSRFAIVRTALWLVANGARRLPAFIGRVSAGKGSSVMDRLAGEIAKLPPETHGPIRAHWSKPASFRMMAHYLRLLPTAAAEALEMPVPAQIPIIILSAATATSAELLERSSWIHDRPASRHVQVPATTHWLQLDRPDLVAAAVRELSEFCT